MIDFGKVEVLTLIEVAAFIPELKSRKAGGVKALNGEKVG